MTEMHETKIVNEVDIEFDVKEEAIEQACTTAEEDGGEHHKKDPEEPEENIFKRITSNVGFFMLAEVDDEELASHCNDKTKQSGNKQNMQAGEVQSVTDEENQVKTSHSTVDSESESSTISAQCEVRLESLALTNEDKGYMRSLIENNNRAELKCLSGDDPILTGPQTKTREDGKTVSKSKTLNDQELLSNFILERAPSPEQTDSSTRERLELSFVEQSNSSTADPVDPMTHNAPSGKPVSHKVSSLENSLNGPDLPKLQLEPSDFLGGGEYEEHTLVDDLLESDSEDEGREEEAETLLKPEELVTLSGGLRSIKSKTAKPNQQNVIDPELQSLFLELESLQASP